MLILVLVLKDSLRTYFKSLSLSWSLGVRSLSWSLGVRSMCEVCIKTVYFTYLSLMFALELMSVCRPLLWPCRRNLSLGYYQGHSHKSILIRSYRTTLSVWQAFLQAITIKEMLSWSVPFSFRIIVVIICWYIRSGVEDYSRRFEAEKHVQWWPVC